MAYTPGDEHLSDRDRNFLQAIKDKFIRSLLAKVGPNSVRGVVIGKILAHAERSGLSWHALLARQLPATVEVAQQTVGLTLADRFAIDYSRKHAGEYITSMAEDTMVAVRDQIIQALQAKTPPKELSRQLFDRFSDANLDWRRIALTETALAVSNGYLASLPEWTLVVGDSSADACPWCLEHIHNRVYRSLPEPPTPADGDRYSEAQSQNYVWPSKTNLGRSRYAVTRDGTKRTPSERWHPCVPAHPTCRCRYRRFIESVEMIQPGTNKVVDRTIL